MGISLLETIERDHMRLDIPAFRIGDTVKVHVKIREGDKERIQVFEGLVIRSHRAKMGATLTVRKVSYGVGVERIFPVHSPQIEKIEVLRRGRIRRSRLYYLRQRVGKAARIREKRESPKGGS
ncbi:MAG TPA: 50S ribosomal protein L19 [Syntrophobacteraceae bacterium]|nr:50S ribosomal protein L19 [Syntrophobacteraceae bacterium]